MDAGLPAGSKASIIAVAVVLLAATTMASPAHAAAGLPIGVNKTVAPNDYVAITIPLLITGETIVISIRVTGPNLDFYFLNDTEWTAFNISWPSIATISYNKDLSSLSTGSIDKTGVIDSGGTYHLAIVNGDQTRNASVIGTIDAPSQYPSFLIALAIVAIVLGAAVAVVAVLLLRRAARLRLSRYYPPGRPTPPGQSHQHAPADKPVIQEGPAQDGERGKAKP